MMKGLIGRKLGMTQMFTEQGELIPVTLIQAGPCYVTQRKTTEKDGYSAIQVGFEAVPGRKITKGERLHLQKAGAPPLRHVREFRVKPDEQYELGQVLDVGQFGLGERVDVVGTSKGRGFAGAVKRHGFAGGPKTHGQSDRHRAVGSIGSGTTPGRVLKGMRMPGHMGNARRTASGLEVVFVDPERHIIGVRGGVPGAVNGLVVIKEARKQ
ncbi:MAG: 50S ribosomal protein L3 [Anaerolineae bacterium]|nr:50S ribosomal protein L3 [Anaerolineae bacterium]